MGLATSAFIHMKSPVTAPVVIRSPSHLLVSLAKCLTDVFALCTLRFQNDLTHTTPFSPSKHLNFQLRRTRNPRFCADDLPSRSLQAGKEANTNPLPNPDVPEPERTPPSSRFNPDSETPLTLCLISLLPPSHPILPVFFYFTITNHPIMHLVHKTQIVRSLA